MGFKQKWKNPAGTRTYYAWRSMHARCRDLNNPHYGGRGIAVCPEWASYDTFYDDMGECPDRHSLDRIDNNLGYAPGNCRWVTLREQLNNQRRNRRITYMGRTQTLSYWAEELGVKPDTLHKRLGRMPLEQALKPGNLRKPWDHGTRRGYEVGCRCDDCRAAHNQRMRVHRARRKEVSK
jgi:hypothetical protein